MLVPDVVVTSGVGQTASDAVPFAAYVRFVQEFGIVPNLCPLSQADAVFRLVCQVDR